MQHKAQPIAALPGFGIAKHGRYWYLVETEGNAQLGGMHNSKAEALAYAYHRHPAYFGLDRPPTQCYQCNMTNTAPPCTNCGHDAPLVHWGDTRPLRPDNQPNKYL